MLKIVNSIIVLFLLSCSSIKTEVDNEILPYSNWYFDIVKSTCNKVNKKVSITFIDSFDNPEILGQCSYAYFTNFRSVKISRFWWGMLNENNKKELIAHELTHCAFSEFGHSKDPNNFMYEKLSQYDSENKLKEDILLFLNSRC